MEYVFRFIRLAVGDEVIITDIHERDAFFDMKKDIIGLKGKITEYQEYSKGEWKGWCRLGITVSPATPHFKKGTHLYFASVKVIMEGQTKLFNKGR